MILRLDLAYVGAFGNSMNPSHQHNLMATQADVSYMCVNINVQL